MDEPNPAAPGGEAEDPPPPGPQSGADAAGRAPPAGSNASQVCTGCGRSIPSHFRFCTHCGRSLSEKADYRNLVRKHQQISQAVAREWKELHQLAAFCSVLLAGNFLIAYVMADAFWSYGLLLCNVSLAGITLIWMRERGAVLKNRFGPGFPLPVLLLILLASVLTFALATFNNTVVLEFLSLREIAERMEGLDKFVMQEAPLWRLILSICVLTAIWEELFFRGMVQGVLERHLTPKEAWLVQAVVFAIAHLNFLGFFTYLLFLGLYLGWLRNRSGSLLPGILAHLGHNLFCRAGGALSVLVALRAALNKECRKLGFTGQTFLGLGDRR